MISSHKTNNQQIIQAMKIKALLPAIFLLLSTLIGVQAQNKIEVNSKQANALIQKDAKIIVVDVRTPEEFNQGHIKGAVNIDLYKSDAISKIDKLNKNANYLVYCRTRNRSGFVVDHMMKSGFKNVYIMVDGFRGWQGSKLPVQK